MLVTKAASIGYLLLRGHWHRASTEILIRCCSAVTPHQCPLPRLRRLSRACTSQLARLAKTQNLVAMNGKVGAFERS